MYNCKYCNKECKNANSLRNHERLCKLNPNRQQTVFQTNNPQKNNPWQSGLSKDTDERLLKISDSLKKGYLEGTIKNHQKNKSRTAEERAKISLTMKTNKKAGGLRRGSGRGKKGWYSGFFCDSTYELAYIIYNLDHNIIFKRCNRVYLYEHNGKSFKYFPDFELADGSLVEIKGYHSEVVDLKTASVTDRPIKVLYENDLQYAFNWVAQNYSYKDLSDLYE